VAGGEQFLRVDRRLDASAQRAFVGTAQCRSIRSVS
jgi:hypothetical protein